jgi:anthranilate synthase component 1
VVFLGYELAAEIEPQLDLAARVHPAGDAPAAFALRIPAGLVYDHVARRAWLFAQGGREDLLEAWSAALAALPGAWRPPTCRSGRGGGAASFPLSCRGCAGLHSRRRHLPGQSVAPLARRSLPPPAYVIERGDAALYERLRAVNPAPFAALAQFQDWRLLSSSPERLVRVADGRVETRPIAGTRPRSGAAGEERARSQR